MEYTLRLKQAAEMTNVANRARENNEFAAALMLYIPALEMIGWEVNSQLGFEPFIKGKFNKAKFHRIRHFSAVSVMLWNGYRYAQPEVLKKLDFTKLSFEKIPKSGGGPEDYAMKPKTNGNQFMSSFADCLAINFQPSGLSDSEREVFLRVRWPIFCLGYSSYGFIDNKRIALLHKDNTFTFDTINEDGSIKSEKTFDLSKECEMHALVSGEIWSGLQDPKTMIRVKDNLKEMLIAFEVPLSVKSYLSS